MHPARFIALTLALTLAFAAGAGTVQDAAQVADEARERVQAALPERALVTPEKPRRLLLFSATRGYRHGSIPVGVEAIRQLGRKTGAFEAVHSEDIGMFEPDKLMAFDAVCMLNTTGELFEPANLAAMPEAERDAAMEREKRLKQSLLDFIAAGRGLVGIHAATDCFYKWPEYGRLIGGYFDGHPWHEKVTIRVETPEHPLCGMFEGERFEIEDEIYQFREPYSRKRQNVLLSLDTSAIDMSRNGVKRTDGDFAVAWARREGGTGESQDVGSMPLPAEASGNVGSMTRPSEASGNVGSATRPTEAAEASGSVGSMTRPTGSAGRVFYCSLGHRDEIYWNPTILKFYLAGIQFALGDLDWLDSSPDDSAKSPPQESSNSASTPKGFTTLFNGKDLTDWKGLVGNPKTRAAMAAEELAEAQKKADAQMREHWSVRDGVLVFDGKGENAHLCTEKEYGDFEMRLDWKIGRGGDSGVYLRGCPQVQIWDPAQWPEGSGGLYNNQLYPSKPHVRADRPIGEWNTFIIRMIGDRVTVHLNEKLVVADVPMENYWSREEPLPARGQIELQSHGSPLYFRDIAIREIPPAEAQAHRGTPGWRSLFHGSSLQQWQVKPGTWEVEEGAAVCRGGAYLWSDQQYEDFILELEFKIPEKGNSGIFFRTADLNDPVQTGIELQVYDTYGQEPTRNSCGAIYDVMAPKVNAVRKPGEWNHVVLRCEGPRIWAAMNGEEIIEMNLDRWTTAGENPDGTKNKFKTAYKEMPRRGYVGFQDHGNPVWYRNIRIKPLSPTRAGR